MNDLEALHRRFAPSEEAFDVVFTHCRIVWAIAEQFLSPAVDADLVRTGALLHDIGVYRLGDDDYIRHGIAGHELLSELGRPERLARFCSHHTGMGLTAADVVAQRLPLPVADYLAETPEEGLVMYADKFHSKRTPPVFVSAGTYLAEVGRFGPDKVERFTALREKFGDPDLEALSHTYGHSII